MQFVRVNKSVLGFKMYFGEISSLQPRARSQGGEEVGEIKMVHFWRRSKRVGETKMYAM